MKRIAILISLSLFLGVPAAQAQNAVVIALLPEATIDQTVFTLDQIARISGGSAESRQRVARLDVGELRFGQDRTVITSDSVRFRLLLAGLEASQFHLVGAKRTTVTEVDEPITQRKLGAAAEIAVRQRYGGDLTGVTLMPTKGIVLPPLDLRPTDRIRLEGRAVGPVPLAGKARTEVTIFVNDTPRAAVPVAIEIRPPEIVRLPFEPKSKQPTVRPVSNTTPKTPLIKAGDRIKIVAALGTARIEALGEAMADGSVGDTIRVRNVESNRVIHGRIESGGVVIVEY